MKFWPRIRRRVEEEIADSIQAALPQFEKFGENLTPNLRALRLAMTSSDILLSMGVSANSVVSKALDITETYCQRPVHIDINSNLIMLSQLRGIDKEPLTLIRPVAPRDVNNMTIQSVQRLIYDISQGTYTLDEAEEKLEDILKKPKKYPWWVVMIGNAGIATGVSLMFTTSWRVILTTFVMGMCVDRLLALFAKRLLPSFFRQILAATFVTLTAALLALLAREGVEFFVGMNPTLLVVGGIVMLVAGLVIVGAIQDAIEEYYLTATSRLLKVAMLTTGIVIGILIGLYAARKLGFGIAVSPDPLVASPLQFQLLGAMVVSAAYALSTQTYYRAVVWAGVIGAVAVSVAFYAREWGISMIPASGIAAVFIGFMAVILARLWKTPSSGLISAGIVPLVPGLALYTGLMQLINYPPGDPLFARGLGTLFSAVATALAIAAGASFGSMIGRPLHHKITHSRNAVSFTGLMRRRLKVSVARKAIADFEDDAAPITKN